MVMAASRAAVVAVQNAKADPTIRGFESAERLEASRRTGNTDVKSAWACTQHNKYRFCKFETCTRQSFGTRPTESTPHPYEAEKLLLKLATDPAIIDIMVRWEWTVLVLGEMDPIDDRLAKQKEAEGSCLLGYNTNQGYRIDIRLRTDDLRSFRPYRQLVTTLLHELAHNLFGPHDDHFWACFAELFAEYATLCGASMYYSGASMWYAVPPACRADRLQVPQLPPVVCTADGFALCEGLASHGQPRLRQRLARGHAGGHVGPATADVRTRGATACRVH
jgi:hypothetical protein